MQSLTASLVALVCVVLYATVATEPIASLAAPPDPECGSFTTEFHRAFADVQSGRRAVPMCPADVGPGLDAPGLIDEFSSVTAANIRNGERMTGTDLDLLAVLVGTLTSGTGEEFVERLQHRLGPGGDRGAVRVAESNLRFIDLRPDGPRGWAYGRGDRVVIAYERSPLGPPSHPLIGTEMKEAVADVLRVNAVGSDPVPPSPWGDRLDESPLANGDFGDPSNQGRVYFQTGPGVVAMRCSINPGGSMVGCDVPGPKLFDMPEGTNQIILDAGGRHYAYSDTPTFTRESAGIAWIGERVTNGAATCRITDQAPMICRIVSEDGTIQRANMQ